MSLALLYFITFLESIGTGVLQRGIYFYMHERLGFGQLGNLLVALAYGVVYVAGALKSHSAASKWGERTVMIATLVRASRSAYGDRDLTERMVLCIGFVLAPGSAD